MYISEEKKIIFFHNGKCAGTTISEYFGGITACYNMTKRFLDQNCKDEYKDSNGLFDIKKYISPASYLAYERQRPGLEGRIFVQHFKYRDLNQILHTDSWKRYFKFCFVRNPYSHYFSYYLQMISAPTRIPLDLKNNINFEDYVFHHEGGKLYMANVKLRAYSHIHDKMVIDFVGKVESFEKDMRCILEKIGIEYRSMHINKKGDGNYLKYYTPKTIAHVNEIYDKDFELFGYVKIDPASPVDTWCLS